MKLLHITYSFNQPGQGWSGLVVGVGVRPRSQSRHQDLRTRLRAGDNSQKPDSRLKPEGRNCMPEQKVNLTPAVRS